MYFAIIAVELVYSLAKGKTVYNLRQTVSNLAAGTLSTLLAIFTKALLIFPYAYLRSKFTLIPDDSRLGLLHHAIAFVGCDLAYYWFHRTAHMANLGWAAHVTHHSSMDYNFSTALRQGAGETTYAWLYTLALAPLVPVEVQFLYKGLNTVYQFFVHTELVGKFWWPVELIMNTPSHHRVHHARNYGRRNFAGMLIVWDRLFGTFEAEDEVHRPCVYGLDARRAVLGTHNPLWHQAHHLAATLRLCLASGNPLRACFTRAYGPGMIQPAVVDAEPQCATPAGEDSDKRADPRTIDPLGFTLDLDASRPNGLFPWETRPLGALDYYAAFHFLGLILPLAASMLLDLDNMPLQPALIAVAATAVSTVTVVSVFNGTRGAINAELLRLAATVALARWAGPAGAGPPPP
ncbi:hypothetical protein H632_c176p1, partial [Helicosporidium sp. ATCC 50920]